jgi:hypothetical protein
MIKKLIVTLAIIGLATTAFASKVDHNPTTTGYYVHANHRGAPIVTEDFEGGIPGGWTITDNAPGPSTCIWGDLAWCGEGGNYTNGSGNCACVSTDICGSPTEVDTELITSAYDLSGASDTVLAFTANYINLVSTEFFDVDYTTDGGATWNNILSWNEDHGGFCAPPGEDVALDMSGADGAAAASVRFYHYDTGSNDWDWYVQVDDMAIEATGGGDGGGAVPTTTGIGVALMVLILLGSSAYFLRRRATN